MVDSRPMADDRQTELAMFRFPHRDLEVEEYAARFAHTIDLTSFAEYSRYRYPEPALDRWLDKLHTLLQSPTELDQLRRKHFGNSEIEYRLLRIGLCNTSDGVLTKWYVNVGDTVRAGHPLMEMETAKAVFDLPCPRTGTVVWLLSNDMEVCLGQPLFRIDPCGYDHESASPESGDEWWCPTNGTHTCEGWPHLRRLMGQGRLAEQSDPPKSPGGREFKS